MSTGTIILLGAIAGFTIYLGLPIARVQSISSTTKIFLSMLATGILCFLLVDITTKMSDELVSTLSDHNKGIAAGMVFLALLGLSGGLVGIIYFMRYLRPMIDARRAARMSIQEVAPPPQELAVASVGVMEIGKANAPNTVTTAQITTSVIREIPQSELALIIAAGIGMHNLAEGLAIGQSAANGELSLAALLIIGFGLHNMTEGFGIAGPLSGKTVSWKFLGLLGLIGGGPTFLGTILGITFHSPALFIFCLAFAAGAILYVIVELLGMARRFPQEIVVWGLLIGFVLGISTDMILTMAGA
jgi:zinc transporter, ZIP family